MTKLDFLTRFAVNGIHFDLNKLLDEMVNSHEWSVRFDITKHPKLTQQQINQLINDEDWCVRCGIALNPNLTKEQLNKLLNDSSSAVRHQAYNHPLYKKEINHE